MKIDTVLGLSLYTDTSYRLVTIPRHRVKMIPIFSEGEIAQDKRRPAGLLVISKTVS